MAGLLAAEIVVVGPHVFDNVAVADGGPRQRQSEPRKMAFESEIGHDRGDDTVPTEPSATVPGRSDEHTSELPSLMRTSYAVFCSHTKQTPPPTMQTHKTT